MTYPSSSQTSSCARQRAAYEELYPLFAAAREENAAGLATHLQDAATAVCAFVLWEGTNPRPQSDVTAPDPISTVGAGVLWSGFSDDVRLLHQQVLVLRPTQLLGADIVAYVSGGATGA